MAVMVTEKAAKEVLKIISEQNMATGTMLRVGVSGEAAAVFPTA